MQITRFQAQRCAIQLQLSSWKAGQNVHSQAQVHHLSSPWLFILFFLLCIGSETFPVSEEVYSLCQPEHKTPKKRILTLCRALLYNIELKSISLGLYVYNNEVRNLEKVCWIKYKHSFMERITEWITVGSTAKESFRICIEINLFWQRVWSIVKPSVPFRIPGNPVACLTDPDYIF